MGSANNTLHGQGSSGESTRVRRGSKEDMNQPYRTMPSTAYENIGVATVDADFESLVRDAVRVMYASVERSDLDNRQRKLITDFGDNGKYVGGLRSILEIAWLCRTPEHAVALPEILRSYALRAHRGPMPVMEAFRREQKANEVGNMAQLEYVFSRSRVTNDRAYEAMYGQRLLTERTMDALVEDRSPLIQVVR